MTGLLELAKLTDEINNQQTPNYILLKMFLQLLKMKTLEQVFEHLQNRCDNSALSGWKCSAAQSGALIA